MGSTGTHRQPGLTDLEFFTQQWPTSLGPEGHWTVLEHNSDREGFYAAIEDDRYEGEDRFWILVVQKSWYPRAAWENFIYKDMSDTMGPGIDGASLAVINAVPPTEHEYAKAWRERVIRLRTQEATIKKALKDGATVTLPHELRFADGVHEKTFIARKNHKNRLSYRRASDNLLVRLPQGWKTLLGTTVTAAD